MLHLSSTTVDPADDVHALIAAMERSPVATPELAVVALGCVMHGLITGEGPTTTGRVHFSRTIDGDDAALCERILLAAGGEDGVPVSRAEAELLFDIDAAGAERTDHGRFDDLFVKAIAHYVLGSAGFAVPARAVALDRRTHVSTWAKVRSSGDIDAEILVWIAAHVNNRKRLSGALAAAAALFGAVAANGLARSVVSIIDLVS
jgi:hypothetical protein